MAIYLAGRNAARFQPNGDLEKVFAASSTLPKPVRAIVMGTDGKLVILRAADSAMNLIRYHSEDTIDASFQPPFFSGAVVPLIENGSLCLQPDGKLVVGGAFSSIGGVLQRVLARLNTDGSLDGTFKPQLNSLNPSYPNRVVRACIALPNGQVLIAGTVLSDEDSSFRGVIRLNANGSLDRSFHASVARLNPSFQRGVVAMAVQSDLRIVIGGDFGEVNGTPRSRVARLNADGTLDLSFDPGEGPDGDLSALVLQPNGKIVIGSAFTSVNRQARKHIARLAPDGQLDLSFLPLPGLEADLIQGWPEVDINALALTADAELLVEGVSAAPTELPGSI